MAGGYTHVSESHGAKTSRFRLSIALDTAPLLIQANGRRIDEVIFMGRCCRVYGKGWYNHRKAFQRADLDIAAKERKITMSGSTPPSQQRPPHGYIDGNEECLILALDCEAICAIGDVAVAMVAPLYYTSDVAICSTTSGPVFALPARGGGRTLASATIKSVLLKSPLGIIVWESVRALLVSAA
ncbi:Aste57867_85 [Aphanomyces stellatus]|uniref:Aste57867_85 protein n=1 Tax=Aphanomyces stellatus TaxID=120398 RepID=A0A485K1X4_9STRA|nr:hypothetical protein As57867_000085 [Aphanomyces stellatus]VFT77311.1 Aste57867_85 [Aphanomyces stellatus]